MRRPLFWACLFLALTAVVHFLLTGGFQAGGGAEGPPNWEKEVVLAGKVCGRETGDRQPVILLEIDILKSSRFAAASQQVISYLEKNHMKKLRCHLAAEVCEAMPEIGSLLVVSGKFSAYEDAANPGEFDLAEYYRANGVGGRLADTVVIEKSAGYNKLGEALFCLREFLGERLDRAFPAKEAGVMKTMLLGDRSGLDPELKELYRKGGIVHILSISGLHITLLGMGIYRLLRRLGVPNGAAALIGGIFLFLYGLMTGMSVSACRAIGMFLLRMMALSLGRTYDMLTALAVLGAGMLCLEPAFLLHSGFWLSFGSLCGVGCVLPVLEELVGEEPVMTDKAVRSRAGRKRESNGTKDKNGRGGRCFLPDKTVDALRERICRVGQGSAESIRGGTAIFLTTLPLQLCFYYEIPVFSMALNLLVLPCMGAVVGCGFLTMLIPEFPLFKLVDILVLHGFERLCRLAQGLPFHTWNPGCPKLWQIGFYYTALAAALLFLQWRRRRTKLRGRGIPAGYRLRGAQKKMHEKPSDRKLPESLCRITWYERVAAFIVKWLVILLPVVVLGLPVHRTTGLVFLDVGQGDGVCLRTENGETWIYDCGSSSKKQVGANILIPFLKHEGIRRIQGVILSHSDKDHVSGLLELFELSGEEGIRIDRVILPDLGDGAEEESFSEIRSYEKEGLLEVIRVRAGDRFGGKSLSFSVLNPEGGAAESDNTSSLCVLAQFTGRGRNASVLLTGDVEGSGEKILIAELEKMGVRNVDVLKCAHHGSKNATSQEFLEAVDAQITVISCGRNNSYGHPHKETLERLESAGSRVFGTPEYGAITVEIDENIKIRGFRKGEIN